MWTTEAPPIPIFEEEDEEELITQFVKYSALYPDQTEFAICSYIFRDLRDPTLRAGQAAMRWKNDLGIMERIRLARANGGEYIKEKLTKEVLQAKILATTEDPLLTPQEKKVRIDGYVAYAQNEGWVVKSIEKKTLDQTRRFPKIIFARDSDNV